LGGAIIIRVTGGERGVKRVGFGVEKTTVRKLQSGTREYSKKKRGGDRKVFGVF